MGEPADKQSGAAPRAIRLEDYTPPPFLVEAVDLRFELDPDDTRVRARLQVRRNPAAATTTGLVLDGQDLETLSVKLNGEPLGEDRYHLQERQLIIPDMPVAAEVEIETRIRPSANTALEGLYVSSGMFCTQCEAEGFRRITWFPDRPDVMARFTTTLVADKERYPVLLSNGNCVEHEELDDGRHRVRWEDPFPKPSYLFALVAGDLVCREDSFTTRSGRDVTLRMYVEPANRDKCEHALASLKQAMRWDEERFGREYDLDVFMIVAVNDFNMGAMENKGLNIFNSACVLASPDTATDADYYNIQSIIGHEYFHNWSGNRVTCRDWFQLSLKEGFTVFRDQEFSADLNSRPVKRISDVNVLRTHQFAQDASPMAHPVRPDSYIEISNFYTVTVYNKGAEVVRMLHTLLGEAGFRKGTDLYFERHDGQAVTTDDFVRAMEDANGVDLAQFRRWYDQAGTPVIGVREDFHDGVYTLTLSQSCPPTPGQPDKLPFHIPLDTALLDSSGRPLPLQLEGESAPGATHRVLELKASEQRFRFTGLSARPVLSLNRGFSAPVRIDQARSDAELAFLLAHDPDPFNRWDAGQNLALSVMRRLVDDCRAGRALALDDDIVAAFGALLDDTGLDRALVAQALTLPSESYLADQFERVDVDAIHRVREFVRRTLADRLYDAFLRHYRESRDDAAYQFDAGSMARRSLKNLCLGYLMETGREEAVRLCLAQFDAAHNMTDSLAALTVLAQYDLPEREDRLQRFYRRWQHDPLVVDKWFAIQAGSRLPDTLERVRRLLGHPAFTLTNPNKVRALIGRFCQGNTVRFHAADGSGYRFLADQVILLDPLNPQIAARLVSALSRWRRHDDDRQRLMKAELERILATPNLSRDVYEIVSKSL